MVKKRKYTKKDCRRWGHVIPEVRGAVDKETGKFIGEYYVCGRCGCIVFTVVTELDYTVKHDLPSMLQESLPLVSPIFNKIVGKKRWHVKHKFTTG